MIDNWGRLAIQGWCPGNDFVSSETGSGSGWLVQSAVLEEDLLSQFRDGRLIDTASHTFETEIAGGKLVLGAELDGAPQLNMDVALVLVFDRALGVTEREGLQSYLEQRFFSP